MNPFREYLANAFATYRLTSDFYVLTSCVGLVGVLVGLVMLWFFAQLVFAFLGVPFDKPIPFSSPASKWMLLSFLVGIPVCIYLGCALVAGILGVVLVSFGRLSAFEAMQYALLSRYPARWFKHRA